MKAKLKSTVTLEIDKEELAVIVGAVYRVSSGEQQMLDGEADPEKALRVLNEFLAATKVMFK